MLPLPKKRGAVAPQGFTRRYGNMIAARMGVVARDGLDACVYAHHAAPAQTPEAPTPSRPKHARSAPPQRLPGEEFEQPQGAAAPPPRQAPEAMPEPADGNAA